MGLVQTMADSCSFADEAEELKRCSERDRDIINQILRQVMECAYFIRDYCNKSFGMWNLACSTYSETDQHGRSQTHHEEYSFSYGRKDR
jgi:hypothetical protein